MKKEFFYGWKDSLPIAAGYFSVSFSFGIQAATKGLSPWIAGIISLTNITSAGQFAGLTLIATHAPYFEMFLTQFIINLRYALMSLSLSQRISPKVSVPKRMLISIAITDEIFAVSRTRLNDPTPTYMMGLEIFPIFAWTAGTVAGSIATDLLPASVQSALGIALYGMFIAIVMPPARRDYKVALVALLAVIISCLIRYVPLFHMISSGFSIIICTIIAAGVGAWLFPEENDSETLT